MPSRYIETPICVQMRHSCSPLALVVDVNYCDLLAWIDCFRGVHIQRKRFFIPEVRRIWPAVVIDHCDFWKHRILLLSIKFNLNSVRVDPAISRVSFEMIPSVAGIEAGMQREICQCRISTMHVFRGPVAYTHLRREGLVAWMQNFNRLCEE